LKNHRKCDILASGLPSAGKGSLIKPSQEAMP
jgi:hypothetical protein